MPTYIPEICSVDTHSVFVEHVAFVQFPQEPVHYQQLPYQQQERRGGFL